VTFPAEEVHTFDLRVDVDHVLRGQGMDATIIRARRPQLVSLAERAAAEGLPLLSPHVLRRRLRVERLTGNGLELEGGFRLTVAALARHFSGASQAAMVVCTIGAAVEERMALVSEEEPAFAMALDGFGTAAAETLATSVCAFYQAKTAAFGLVASAPIGPGHSDWPVEEGQPEVFAALQPDPLIVRLEPGGIMAPRKSISFVIGFGMESGGEHLSTNACALCYLKRICQAQLP
jgi:hypothetical protein